MMSGISAIKSKIKTLLSKTKIEPKQVSVVFYEIGKEEEFVFPENCNESGVLLVPKTMSIADWERADFSRDIL